MYTYKVHIIDMHLINKLYFWNIAHYKYYYNLTPIPI